MALVSCPECSRQVSDHASACPHCGYPLAGFTDVVPEPAISRAQPETSHPPSPEPNSGPADRPLNPWNTPPQKSWRASKWTPVVILTLFLGSCYFMIRNSSAPSESSAVVSSSNGNVELLEVDAPVVYAAYESNEVRADQIFKGRKVRLSGYVRDIGTGLFGEPIIYLDVGDTFRSVHARTPRDELSRDGAARLEKGDFVRLVCTGSGVSIGSPQFRDCTPP
jgi:hypothetical protein